MSNQVFWDGQAVLWDGDDTFWGAAPPPPVGPPAEAVQPSTVLLARDGDGVRQGQIDDFTSLTVTARFNDADTWVLDLPTSPVSALLLADGAGLVVERDGQVLTSGPVVEVQRQVDAQGDRLTVAGVSDDVWLARRVALPDTSVAPAGYDVRTGQVSAVLSQYVDVNAGPSAPLERRQVVLGTDPAVGSTVTGRARFQQLDVLLRQLALAGGDVGWKVVDLGGSLTFEVYQPTDRTDQAVFSFDLGNLASFTSTTRAPEANYLYVAGQGQLENRTVVEGGDTAGIDRWGRIEQFADRRDTDDTGELVQARDELLIEQAAQFGLALEPVDTVSLAFGTGYQLGDKVTVEVDGSPVVDVVRTVTITWDASGQTVVPSVQSASSRQMLRLFERQRSLARRLADLERAP